LNPHLIEIIVSHGPPAIRGGCEPLRQAEPASRARLFNEAAPPFPALEFFGDRFPRRGIASRRPIGDSPVPRTALQIRCSAPRPHTSLQLLPRLTEMDAVCIPQEVVGIHRMSVV
jgi:hypothetical protein